MRKSKMLEETITLSLMMMDLDMPIMVVKFGNMKTITKRMALLRKRNNKYNR
jgi:hypothetical protein